MIDPSAPASPLSPHRAFVVPFRVETAVVAGHVSGCVEHLVSGQATPFDTLDALLACIARVLAERGAGPPAAGKAGGVPKCLVRHAHTVPWYAIETS